MGTEEGDNLGDNLTIDFSDYCRRVYPPTRKKKALSGPKFVIGLFQNGGSSYFTDDDVDNVPKQMYKGKRQFTIFYRKTFGPTDYRRLSGYLHKRVEDIGKETIARNFCDSSIVDVDGEVLSMALAFQFRAFVDNTGKDDLVPNIVQCKYQELLAQKVRNDNGLHKIESSLIPGDMVHCLSRRVHYANCYETILHHWTLINTGTCKWENRRLVMVANLDDGLFVSVKTILLPSINPKQSCTLQALVRHSNEGKYNLVWQMHDQNGQDCFPNEPDAFCFKVDVTFVPEENKDE